MYFLLNLVKLFNVHVFIIQYIVNKNIIGAPKIKQRRKNFAITNLHFHYEPKIISHFWEH